MAYLNKSRVMAEVDGDFLIFIVELQIHMLWKIRKCYPVVKEMNQMLVELTRQKEYGLLNYEYWFAFRRQLFLMYWRCEDMHNWALIKKGSHIAGWKMLNRLMKEHPDVIGFWHESHVVEHRKDETFYRNVPPVGLGRTGEQLPVTGRMSTGAAKLRAARSIRADYGSN